MDGPIVVELTWNSNVNLDLSILEPGNGIVFKGNTSGTSGILEKFDQEEYAENYYVPDGRVYTGLYEVRVQYVNGSVPTKAKIMVKAGTYFLKEFDLLSATQEPNDIVYINVTRNLRTGVFSYSFIVPQTPIDQGQCDEENNNIKVELLWSKANADLDLHIL